MTVLGGQTELPPAEKVKAMAKMCCGGGHSHGRFNDAASFSLYTHAPQILHFGALKL